MIAIGEHMKCLQVVLCNERHIQQVNTSACRRGRTVYFTSAWEFGSLLNAFDAVLRSSIERCCLLEAAKRICKATMALMLGYDWY